MATSGPVKVERIDSEQARAERRMDLAVSYRSPTPEEVEAAIMSFAGRASTPDLLDEIIEKLLEL